MNGKILELNEKDFDSKIKKGRWVIDFWATWCGPCKIMSPHFDSVAKDNPEVNFAKVNIDDNFELTSRLQIMSVPTLMFFEDGQAVHAAVGGMNREQIIEQLENIFS